MQVLDFLSDYDLLYIFNPTHTQMRFDIFVDQIQKKLLNARRDVDLNTNNIEDEMKDCMIKFL